MTTIMDKIFSKDNLSAREQVTEWYKLKEKLGNRVAGKFMGYWEVPPTGVYGRQMGVALQDFMEPGKIVGVNLPEYFESELATFHIGDEVGAEYYADKPAKEPGLSPTKAVHLINVSLKERQKNGTSKPVDAATTPETAQDDPGF